MTNAQRFASLSILGVMALAIAPMAGAQGFGLNGTLHGRGHIGFGGSDIDAEARTQIRAELKACKEDHADDREAMKACADAVLAEYGIEKPTMPHRPGKRLGHRFRLSIEETCGEREDTDDWKACAKEARGEVREDFRENRPERGGLFGSADLRSELKACLELEDGEELRECVFGVRAQMRANLQN